MLNSLNDNVNKMANLLTHTEKAEWQVVQYSFLWLAYSLPKEKSVLEATL